MLIPTESLVFCVDVDPTPTPPEDHLTKAELLTMIANGEDVTLVDTSHITDMSSLFAGNATFNQDISAWDTSSATNMSSMFGEANSFNQNLSSWSDHVVETIGHTYFSIGGCPLATANHPYASWND